MDSYHDMACVVCGYPEAEPCHIKSRGAGGGDFEENLIPMCQPHHQEQHRLGWYRMAEKYQKILEALVDRGWLWNNGKLIKIRVTDMIKMK